MRVLTSLVLLASLLACDGATPAPQWAGTIDTAASGRVTVVNPAEGVWRAGTGWRVVEELRIGAPDGSGPDVLGDISALAEDVGGQIWALEAREQTFKVFDRAGRFVRTVGRQGGGPGEFRQVAGVARTRDQHLVVVDFMGARISVIDTAGVLVRSYPTTAAFAVIPWPGGVDTAGHFYGVVARPTAGDVTVALVRHDTAMMPLDTLLPPSRPKRQQAMFGHPDGGLRASIPFSPSVLWRLTTVGDFWSVETGTYTLYRHSARGDTLREARKPFQVVPVTSMEKDLAVRELVWFTKQGGVVDRGQIPDVKPAVEDLEVSEDGYLWVAPTVADTALAYRVVDIFDPAGRFLGSLRLPFKLLRHPRPVLRRDHLIAVTVDDEGIPYIVRARIER